MIQSTILIILVLASVTFAQVAAPPSSDLAWPPITRQQKPWTRWWWPGNAVDAKNLSRELEQLHDAGIGGVEITPIYGIQGADDREIKFLSPQWIDMLKHVGTEGKRLDLGVDMATCTGWPFGGPGVTVADADAVIRLESDKLVTRPSKMKVKRAAPGGEGWVLNPFSVGAADRYLKVFEVLSGVPKGDVRAQFHDSFEYAGNWSDDVFDVFQKLHGYDLHDRAKELFGTGDPDTVARVKSDYREALAAAHLAYINEWVKWCHDHGYLARNQAHGAPGNLLDLYAASDIAETEIFGSTPFTIPGFRRDADDIDPKNEPRPLLSRFASSAAHVSGHQLSSSETLTWLRDHFKVALSMCKPEVDQLFLCGINHIFFHGTCYSPDDAAWPGWLFYASTEMNSRDTLWRNVPAMNTYIARCQAVLQAGAPDNDILLYWPVFDAWHNAQGMEQRMTVHASEQWLDPTSVGKTARDLIDRGYAFDYVSDSQLGATTNDGDALRTSGGAKYRALMVPATQKMPPATLAKMVELARGGATVIFCSDIPQDVPGLGKLDERREQMKSAVAGIDFAQSDIGPRVADVGKGKLIVGNALDMILPLVKIRHESFIGDGVGFIRRKVNDGTYYFIASLGKRAIDGWTPLAVACESAVIMDPLTGKTGVAQTRKPAQGDGTEVYLKLEPGQSIIVRTFTSKKVQGQPWENFQPTGEPIAITGQWRVDFIDGGPELPKPFVSEKLQSWTKPADDEAKRFAGTARYKISFDKPSATADSWMLDLGDVRESARVKLNGQDVGIAWSLPFKLQVPASLLHDGQNLLEIEVTNLPANRIRDLDQRGVKWRIFKEINYVNIHYKPFDASKWSVTDSGLLGPVRLLAMKRVSEGK